MRGTAVASAALLLAGCGAAARAGHTPAHAADAAPAAAVTTAPTTDPLIAAAARWRDPGPDLAGDTVLLRTGRRTGSATLPLSAERSGGFVTISYECQGAGKLTVAVGGGGYVDVCSDVPDGGHDEQGTGGSTGSTVRVTADPGVTWAIAVGWEPAAKPGATKKTAG